MLAREFCIVNRILQSPMPNEYSDCLYDKLVKKGKFIKYEMLLANRKTTCIMLVIMKMP